MRRTFTAFPQNRHISDEPGGADAVRNRQYPRPMSNTTSAELSLINDSEFLDELEQFEAPPRHDGFDGLESGLPMHPEAPAIDDDLDHSTLAAAHADPNTNPYDEPIEARRGPAETPVHFVAVALILAVCMSAGAATAAYVFHDQLTRLIAPRAASR